MTPRQRLSALLSGEPGDRLLVDIGTSTLTALRPPRQPSSGDGRRYSDPVMHLLALSDAELNRIGSQTRRCGPSFLGATFDDAESFLDRDGVQWIWADGEPAPLRYPLSDATIAEIVRSRRTPLPPIEASCLSDQNRGLVVIADAPTTGILDTAFRLRGYAELLEDTVDNWPIANALFDRATRTIIEDYRTLLRSLPADPDIVVYGDDLAYDKDLYFSEERFAFFIRPRLTRILSTIRSLADSEILFHSCGASLPVLEEIVALGVRIINFQPGAAGMQLARVRKILGPVVVFHGVLDFIDLFRALSEGNRAAVETSVDSVLAGWPMIASPADNVPATMSPADLRIVTFFLESLDLPALLRGDRSCIGHAFAAACGQAASAAPVG
jgi:Uroporphyrinogen decarboxylase (URO-D)